MEFYKHSRDQVWESFISLEGSIQKQSGFICILNVLGVITNWFWQFSCFSLFYCCRIDSLLSSVSQLVIQALEYMKLSTCSNITANLMAVSLWQQYFCMWLFWTKSLVLHVIGVIFVFCYSQNWSHWAEHFLIFSPYSRIVFEISLCSVPCDMNC
jgi:hypothetical protein